MTHILEIYEPYNYAGQNPIPAEGVAVLNGPLRDDYYLLQVTIPIELDGDKIEQFLVSPRYNGDKIDRAVSSTCTVSIARVPEGMHLDDHTRLSFDEILRWGVGKISLMLPH